MCYCCCNVFTPSANTRSVSDVIHKVTAKLQTKHPSLGMFDIGPILAQNTEPDIEEEKQYDPICAACHLITTVANLMCIF